MIEGHVYYDVDLVAPFEAVACRTEPPEGYCGLADNYPGHDAVVLDHYVGCFGADADLPWMHALGRVLDAYDRTPASEAAGPLQAVIQRYRERPDGMPAEGVWFLTQIRDACMAHPSGVLDVSASPSEQFQGRRATG